MRYQLVPLVVAALAACSSPAVETPPPSTILLPADSAPVPRTIAIGSITPAPRNDGNTWRASVTIAVLDDLGSAVPGARVSGAWDADDAGKASCTTDEDGVCIIESDSLPKRVRTIGLEITGLEHEALTYDPGRNAVDDPAAPVVIFVDKS